MSEVKATPQKSFLRTITSPLSVVTPIAGAKTFPGVLSVREAKYASAVTSFTLLVQRAASSEALLDSIRAAALPATVRMSYLKIFRRCVSTSLDTEMAKKIEKVTTKELNDTIGYTFKPISDLKAEFSALTAAQKLALVALLGENDERGKSGYELTDTFFTWFRAARPKFTIDGPTGAGRDIELSTLYPKFVGNFPCDFVIRAADTKEITAVGFARYDASRGGAQSDDRTGGNSDKVSKAMKFCEVSKERFRIVFLAEGPGLAHSDTWEEACLLDGAWDDNVRVTTLKLSSDRLTDNWLSFGRF